MTDANLAARGVLKEDAPAPFTLTRHAPSRELDDLVELYWFISWNLPKGQHFSQRVLSHPSLHIVIESERAYVSGIPSRCYVRQIEGSCRVASVKLHPGQASRILPEPAHAYTDREVPLEECFPTEVGQRLRRDLLEARHGSTTQRELFERFLIDHARPIQRANLDARRLVERIEAQQDITRVQHLSHIAEMSDRSLQRMFMDHVGVSPKWVIQRYRLHEAAALLEAHPERSIASIAQDLGYFDQAHFGKEFKNFTGQSPGDYRAPSSRDDL